MTSVPARAESECPPPDYSVGIAEFHQIILMQGNDPTTDMTEPKGGVQIIQRTYWSIPWNSSEVYMSIPADAGNIQLDHVESVAHGNTTVFLPGRYSMANDPDDPPATGRVEGGDYDGFYYWRFGAGADRDSSSTLGFDSTADFEDYDPELTGPDDWVVTNGDLALAENVSEATYTSKMYSGGEDIVSLNMTYEGLATGNMSFEVTVDNGTTWLPVAVGEPLVTKGGGGDLRWRVTMTQNVSDPAQPVLGAVAIDVVFTPTFTEIWLEATYTMWIPEEGTNFTLFFPFDLDSSNLIFVGYADKDMTFIVAGMDVTRSVSAAQPDKFTYTHMQGKNDCDISFQFEFHVKPGTDPDFPWLLYLLPLVLVMLIGLLYYLTRSTGEPGGGEDEDELEEHEDGGDEGEPDLDAMDEDELEERKASLLASIKRVEQEHQDGIVGEEELEVRRDMYKREAIEVMKRLHDLRTDDER